MCAMVPALHGCRAPKLLYFCQSSPCSTSSRKMILEGELRVDKLMGRQQSKRCKFYPWECCVITVSTPYANEFVLLGYTGDHRGPFARPIWLSSSLSAIQFHEIYVRSSLCLPACQGALGFRRGQAFPTGRLKRQIGQCFLLTEIPYGLQKE